MSKTKRVLAVDLPHGVVVTRDTNRDYTHAISFVNGETGQRNIWSWHGSERLAQKEIGRVKSRFGWDCETFVVHETRLELG
ncbi:MAG: hypothetical protein DWQ28_08430 [Proteobacteria bacterium]|nr:MAG: hypothetical protein DWQ28_08155 [Pseudomonadota bacterium]REJ66100.1 MAG: hypothetical protein DWQ28_08430 [Pseudomonadota bacterium]|tara:strand:- start:538 stop:780 length:243 start_codon:yes stop_codon:yes gene_type:complete